MALSPINLIYYKNDNSGTTSDIIIMPQESYTICNINNIPGPMDPNQPDTVDWTREGYVLIEWNTSADGTGIGYQPGDVLNPVMNYTVSESYLPLYAIWGVLQDNSVHFKVGSQSDYDSVDKESNSLYFITDSGASRIYKGETLIATLNDDYIVDNTGNNITVNINNNTHKISAEIGESIMSILNNMESEWGEIPERN